MGEQRWWYIDAKAPTRPSLGGMSIETVGAVVRAMARVRFREIKRNGHGGI
jgi:hypothetical protein